MARGCRYGTHRVIDPPGALPQAAWRIDNTMSVWDNEILIDVQTLNIDAASFTQIKHESGGDPERIAQVMLAIVEQRGKHHNPVTGSGGMLIGTVAEIGADLSGRVDLAVGDRIATLVSLSLTPLVIDKILGIDQDADQVQIEGRAILFESGIFAKLPEDMPDTLALAVLDVAGAPAQTARLVKPGDTVFIIGAGGKSGLLCMYEARKRAGVTGRVIALTHSDASRCRAAETGWADVVLQGNATQPLEVLDMVGRATDGRLADITVNCVNIPGTEMSSILSTRDGGLIYFFSMATSFTAAALGAEGVGKDVTMLIGNGYTRGHAEIALADVRESAVLRRLFEKQYVK
ncbi:MAG: L-erythro-3,5-diaminohexanoate dehydrogenase [Firmicutes bacterium]|jgi:L-erythro-3,5-diaminohexanoate dehydrogenase|nr:L-erythro-3,5-diaminohexanoate dehydrogenase [Bacillota bacterium]